MAENIYLPRPPIAMDENQTFEHGCLFTWGSDGIPVSIVNMAYAEIDAQAATREQEEAWRPSINGSQA